MHCLMNFIMHCSHCPFFYVHFVVANDRGFARESAEGCRVIQLLINQRKNLWIPQDMMWNINLANISKH